MWESQWYTLQMLLDQEGPYVAYLGTFIRITFP